MLNLEEVAREVNDSGIFDEAWYTSTYQDVAIVGLPPLYHFVQFGLMLKRDPGPDFDTQYYLENNADVAAAGADPVIHYIRHGKAEGRRARI
ncbi:hypothetical protein ACFSUK_15110 [Sphingobium scionense]|uniref:Uncharacterized protein n=1 Tax=Sphingobium scionense TaxID=1404341 RepID=A0A7W6LQE2_9SPHN|nr:hypothetical protein [Sphingobium scionense]MBB4148595.1 hypothetical protein [Sphingobium scionense]